MKIWSTNINATFLLLIVAIPLLLSIGFLLNQLIIEAQMEYELETAATQKLKLAKDEIQWIKKNNEILINGKFFDLKSYSVDKDSIIVEGIFDEDEDVLNKKYRKLFDRKKQGHPYNNSLAFLFIFNSVLPPSPPLLGPDFLSQYNKKWDTRSHNILSQFLLVNTPPPMVRPGIVRLYFMPF